MATLGKDFCLSVILNMHISPHSPKLLFSLSFSHREEHKHEYTPRAPNHCKQQFVVNASPRSAVAEKREREKKRFVLYGYF